MPGNLSKETNYLEFETPEKCVEEVTRLYINDELRYKIVENNNRYYHEYLHPDRLALNTLKLATSNNI